MSAVPASVPFGCSTCCIPAQEWFHARRWGAWTARAVGAREPEWGADVQVRTLELVRACWPCRHAVAPRKGQTPVVSPEEWRRLHAALVGYTSGVHGERAVLDVLKDIAGDEPRRRAATAPFTCRPERVLDGWVLDEQEQAVAVALIGAVQSFRHATAALWALDGCPAADAAAYVLGAVASRRRVAGERHVLAGLGASEIAALAVSARDFVRRAFPGRWAGLQAMAREVLATAPVGPDGTDRCDGEDRGESGVDCWDLVRRALSDDEVLSSGGTFDDFVSVLDRHCLLPEVGGRRTERLAELRPAWTRYRRSR